MSFCNDHFTHHNVPSKCTLTYNSKRHKTNANYENLMSNKVEPIKADKECVI